MERRTNGELLDAVRDLLDEASTPYFSDPQVCDALNAEYTAWLSETARGAERDEQKRRTLSSLTVQISPVVEGGRVDLGKLTVDDFRLLAVSASYTDCNADRAVRPLPFDAYQTAKRDPFNAPTSRFPAYLDSGDVIEILPPPAGVKLVYLSNPKRISSDALTDRTEVGYEIQTRLIERAAKRLAIPQFSSEVYQTLAAENASKGN